MTNAPRLSAFSVVGLFGAYDHTVNLNLDSRITSIIGPNGIGKTVCLKLIKAFFDRNLSYFDSVEFSELKYALTDGSVYLVKKAKAKISKDADLGDAGGRALAQDSTIELSLALGDGALFSWRPWELDSSGASARKLQRYLPFLERTGPDSWFDRRRNDAIRLDAVVKRYAKRLPANFIAEIKGSEPEQYIELTQIFKCSLIETQRLIVLPDQQPSMHFIPRVYDEDEPEFDQSASLAIEQKAALLREIIRSTQNEYAVSSQELDRSFPRRVLEARGPARLDVNELSKELEELDRQRQQLVQAGILDAQLNEHIPLLEYELESGVGKVLEIYLQDSVKKISMFKGLLGKIGMFKALVAERFLDKEVLVDRRYGFKIVSTKKGSDIPLDKLSSGEQHQLILLFDLLFEVKSDSLILIDEPELSLHLHWQRTFIDSLMKIISLNPFDVVVATHSPPLVARYFDLTVELGKVDIE